MRALRVVGLHEDGKSVVCEDPARRERFVLPADERLRAAARGDITRLGQIEIELESQMRPREIQARIRAGESVEQVATSAGVPVERVDRFAYPVLLERSRTAAVAQSAHPVRADGPDVRTLGEVVSYAFGVRGQDYSQSSWDAWRGDDGKWIIELQWKAGRSDNRAHWTFAPGAHGGTVTPIDEHAEHLLDPNAALNAPTLRAVVKEHKAAPSADAEQPMLESFENDSISGTLETESAGGTVIEAPIPDPIDEQEQGTESSLTATDDVESAPPQPKSKKGHPVVPAWEDVLLGVRSQRANGS